MNSLQVLNKLFRHLSDIPSTAPITTTVVSANRLTIEVADNLGADNSRQYHVVWPQGTSTFINEPLVIASHTGTTIQLFNPFDSSAIIPVGTSITINKGPLGDAKGYFLQPDNITDLEKDSVFWTVGLIGHNVAFSRLEREKTMKTGKNQARSFSVAVLAETPNALDVSSVDDEYLQKIKPYVFSEQIIAKLHTFVTSLPGSYTGANPVVEVNFGMIERDGGEPETQAINHVIEFVMHN